MVFGIVECHFLSGTNLSLAEGLPPLQCARSTEDNCAMQIPYLDRKVAGLTVLQMQDVWIALEAGEPADFSPKKLT